MVPVVVLAVTVAVVWVLAAGLSRPPPEPSTKSRCFYFDNNATTPIHPEALACMTRAYRDSFANPSSYHYAAGRHARHVLHHSRQRLAKCLGVADCNTIVFVSGATEANNLGIIGRLLRVGGTHKPPHVLVTPLEHASVYNTLASLPFPVELETVPVDSHGLVCLTGLKALLRDDTALVCIIMANNEIGSIQPDMPAIARLCRHAHLHCDLTQMVGKYPVSLDAMGANSVALSAHKFGGPRGIGALYVRDLDTVRPIMHGGGQERGWRPGTENVPAVVGMARALEIAQERMREEGPRVAKMADGIRAALLASVPGALNLGHPQHRLYNTVAIALPIDSRQLLSRLDGDGICVSAGSACTRGGDSHALAALGLSPEVRRGSLRISLWYDNTPHQCRVLVERIVHHVNELVHEAAPRPIPPTHT